MARVMVNRPPIWLGAGTQGERESSAAAAECPAYRFMSPHGPGSDDDEAAVTAISNDEWCSWLHAELRACPAYATHGALLDECCAIAARWRTRFWGRKALWNRMRRGSRLAKELAEAAPVLERARLEAQSVKLEGGARVVVIDLCSGFGYMAMFLSELLPPDKVRHALGAQRCLRAPRLAASPPMLRAG